VNEYKPDDLVWVKMRGYPWWPARIFNEENASEEVVKKKKNGSHLVHFLEANLFSWINDSDTKPLRGDSFDDFSKQAKKPKDWKKAFELVCSFEKGEYVPPVTDDTDEEEELPTVGVKRRRSTSSKKKDTTATTTKKKKDSTAPPPAKKMKSSDKPTVARKKQSKVTQVPMSNDFISNINGKLEKNAKEGKPEKIQTLLEILSKIEIADISVLSDIPIMNTLENILADPSHSKTTKQISSKLLKSYGSLVKSHQKTKAEPKATSSKSTKNEKNGETEKKEDVEMKDTASKE